ncbi:MAG: response regulator [Lentisphaerae bacterium]|jgi:CheY-like chemotaxis protein/anti-sigma regulatory factor (Ser/Thr protein kinase)|nr:response regulator [Lentisphaerota bacterium]MBT4814097.1 response regulator [Lentisphaerota bacterium]MBT5604571.1 response regulator [Lentisphaerota bacterium]MBT7061744.1 response regulator [Lentisphaerota bacterium]MBT7848798.1 response regulator [Lentisphaerota bacterium]
MNVMIVDDEATVRKILHRQVRRLGHTARSAENGREALDAFEVEPADVVITDVRMPVMDGLELLKEIRERSPQTIVIVITGAGSVEYAAEALRLGAHNYLDKPFKFAQIRQLLDKCQQLVEDLSLRQECELRVTHREVSLVLENERRLVPAAAGYLLAQIGQRLPEPDRMGLLLGLVELLNNAIEHGNLGIGSGEKERALDAGGDAFELLFGERLANPELAGRRVLVELTMDTETARWTIRDEGTGFDWESVVSNFDPNALLKPCGRGVFLSRMQFDELEYRGCGNEVCAVKKLNGEGR